MSSPTITSPATGFGIVLGTAAYMSPEQGRGRTADRRADIWAFGSVVFELLTGERLFAGETVSDTIAAVLREGHPVGSPAGEHAAAVEAIARAPSRARSAQPAE